MPATRSGTEKPSTEAAASAPCSVSSHNDTAPAAEQCRGASRSRATPICACQGVRAVLEVRSRDVPFIIEDGQIVGRLVYESMAARPEALYGADLKSNDQGQALKLSKHFRG